MRILFSLRQAGVVCLLVLAGAAGAAPVALTLREQVVIDHAGIVLADLLGPNTAVALPFATLDVGRAPRVGYTVRITRAELENQLRRQFPGTAVRWDGAAMVTVRIQAQAIEPARVREATWELVRAAFAEPGTLIDIDMPGALPDIPAGAYTLRTRPLTAGAPVGRLPVWIDVLVDGAVYRSLIVTASVRRDGQAFVARRALDAGSRISPDDFIADRLNIAGMEPLSSAAFEHDGARLRSALRPGQVLDAQALAPAGAVFHGDQVLVTVRGGGIDVEALAVAQGPALPGQIVSLRASSSGETLRGRVTRAGHVVIE